MNTINEISIISPDNAVESCAEFFIDEPDQAYTLIDTLVDGRKYTFSCWVKALAAGTITAEGETFEITTEWKKIAVSFTANSTQLQIKFSPGTYHVYHPMLETGNKASDWTPNPDDVEHEISLKVGKVDFTGENIISKINLAPGAALIEAAHINLRGSVTISDLDDNLGSSFVTDKDGVTQIDGGNIKTGTITALGEVTAGSFDIGSGKFKVSEDGILEATDAIIRGTVYAKDSEFSGDITAKNLTILDNAKVSGLTISSVSELKKELQNAAATATNFLYFDPDSDDGLNLGYKVNGEWTGTRAQVLGDSFNILDADDDILSSLGEKKILLGAKSDEAIIELCAGSGYIKSYEEAIGTEWKRLLIGAEHSFGIETTGNITFDTKFEDPNDPEYYAMATGRIKSGVPWESSPAPNGLIDFSVNYKGIDYAANTFLTMYSDSVYLGAERSETVEIALHGRTGQLVLTGSFIELEGESSISKNMYTKSTNVGFFLTDSEGFSFPGIYNNSDNLWIGATKSASQHHTGKTYISAGHNGTKGNETIYVSVPNANNDGATNHALLHSENYMNYITRISNHAVDSVDAFVGMYYEDDLYYLRPYAASKVVSGSMGFPWYNTWTERLNVTKERIVCKPSYDKTVTYSPNLYVGTSGMFSRYESSSSRTIKHDIKDLSDEDLKAEHLYDIGVVQFKYNDGIITEKTDARYGKDLPGFIIEDLVEKYPIAVDMTGEDISKWSWNERYLIPPMLKLLQDQHREIEYLKSLIIKTKEN